MFPSIFTLATLLSILNTISALDAWHLDETAILANEQLDPIINPNGQSSHMHKIMGGSAFAASYNYDTYSKAKCSSLKLAVDKSNYWMPNLYAKSPTTGKFTSIPVNARFYYFLGRNSPNEPVKPFPDGLRMLAGSPMAKSRVAKADFYCQIQPDFLNSIEGENFNYNRDCPNGMKTDLYFPPCWDGINLWKSDMSHMAYPLGSVNANSCPISHPVRLPAILLEYTWLVSQVMPNTPLAGNLVWANGDTTGYGVHGDFVSGWDSAVLQRALNSPGCAIGTNEAIPIIECDVFQPYFQSTQAMKDCKPDNGILVEPRGNDDFIELDALPGCNPIWGNTTTKPTCASPAPQLDLRGLTGTDGPVIAMASQQFQLPVPTTPGWMETICINGIQNIVGGVSYIDPNLTPQSCQASCSKAGYSFAAVGFQESIANYFCVCGSSLNPNAAYTPGQCTNPCPGDSTKTCGGNYLFSVYQAGPGTTITLPKTPDNSSILGCYMLPSDRSTGLPGSTTYTFQSGSMTRDLCIQACKQFGSSWAYTSAQNTCACGTTFNFSPGAFVPDSFCPLNCNGNSQQKCGDYYRAMVYNIGTSDVSTTPAVKPEGLAGCYTSTSFIAGNGFTYSSQNGMTTSLCRRTCRSRGFAFAGLGGGQNCYCSSTPPSSSDLVASAVCNNACSGDMGSTCGADSSRSLSIYDTTGAGAQTPSGYPANYVGCSSDGNPRSLTGRMFESYTLTSAMCRDVCASYGFMVYGTQYSYQCYCGNDLGPRGLIPDSQCSAGCSGNSNERCGGPYIFSMYSSQQQSSDPPSTPSPSPSPSSTSTSSSKSTTTTTTTTASPTATPSPPAVPGCYSSTSNSIASLLITSSSMTPTICKTWCGVNGFAYSMLTAGNSCGCRATLTSLTRVADSSCSTGCSGAIKSICGGSNNVWSISTSTAKSSFCSRSMPRRYEGDVEGGFAGSDLSESQMRWNV